METLNIGEEELSVSETVFTNNSDSTDNDNQDLSEHGMSGGAAEIFREFSANADEGAGGSSHVTGGGEASPRDVQSIIAQKERDLILAAELGKALLEENEELARKQEHIAKEHAEQIEVCAVWSISI